MHQPRSILITGASSGLGKALALAYAAPDISLALTGRNQERLEAVAKDARAAGAKVLSSTLCVTEEDKLSQWINSCDDESPLDLVIANAGISAGTAGGPESDAQTRQIFAVNVTGVMNTLGPAVDRMRRRGQGQLAIVSSLASFRGFPGAPAYCASKAAVRVWGEALRGSLYEDGISVNVICPGYVKTPMTDVNDFPMPGLMSAERAASIIQRALAKNKSRIAFPLRTYWATRAIAALPMVIADPLLRRLPKKK